MFLASSLNYHGKALGRVETTITLRVGCLETFIIVGRRDGIQRNYLRISKWLQNSVFGVK